MPLSPPKNALTLTFLAGLVGACSPPALDLPRGSDQHRAVQVEAALLDPVISTSDGPTLRVRERLRELLDAL